MRLAVCAITGVAKNNGKSKTGKTAGLRCFFVIGTSLALGFGRKRSAECSSCGKRVVKKNQGYAFDKPKTITEHASYLRPL
jgi:hypothetical protein